MTREEEKQSLLLHLEAVLRTRIRSRPKTSDVIMVKLLTLSEGNQRGTHLVIEAVDTIHDIDRDQEAKIGEEGPGLDPEKGPDDQEVEVDLETDTISLPREEQEADQETEERNQTAH